MVEASEAPLAWPVRALRRATSAAISERTVAAMALPSISLAPTEAAAAAATTPGVADAEERNRERER